MMHSKVEPNDQVFLLQALSVKEVVEIHRRVVHILAVVSVGASGLSVLAFCDLEVMFCPTCRIDQVAAVLHGQMCQPRIRQD